MKMLMGSKMLGLLMLFLVLVLDHFMMASHVVHLFGIAGIVLLISDGLVEVAKVLKKK